MNNCLLFFQNDNKNDNLLEINLVNQKIKKLYPTISDQLRFFKINKKKWSILTKFNFDTKKVLFFENYIIPKKKFIDILYNDVKNFSTFPLSLYINNSLFPSMVQKDNLELDILNFPSNKINKYDSKIKGNLISLGKNSSLFFCITSENNLSLIYNLINSSPFLPIGVISPNCKTVMSKRFVEKLKKYPQPLNNSLSENTFSSDKQKEKRYKPAAIIKQKIDLKFFYFFFKKKICSAATPFFLQKKTIKGE